VAALWLAVVAAGPAGAANYTVNPVQVTLSAEAPSALVTLTSQADQPVSFEVEAFRWTMDDTGESALEPTDEILAFPPLLTLEPGAERKLRIGTLAPFDDTERTYRVLIEELRPPERTSGTRIRILTRVSLPVFLAPSTPRPELAISGATLREGRLRFALENRGNVHVTPHWVFVTGRAADGGERFGRQLEGWYVLAGSRRPYEVEIPDASCRELAALGVPIEIEVAGDGVDRSKRVPVPDDACPP
jgi:fimbrial chaperone protein